MSTAMDSGLVLILVITALLVGLAVGKAWERYKLQEGQWVDRRRVRQSAHFIVGLNYLVAGRVDLAIEELEEASKLDPGALELRLMLGNLYREHGQVGRAIQEHQSLLQRPRLSQMEHANVLLCLGLDYRRGGFVDRATEAFTEVLKLAPDNESALNNLEKLQEEQHQWQKAYQTRQRLAAVANPAVQTRSKTILALLEHELGLQALAKGDIPEAIRRFTAAIDLHKAVLPAYLSLGDARLKQGDAAAAATIWEAAVNVSPDRAYLPLERLEALYVSQGRADRFIALCERLTDAAPREWRARAALARHLVSQGQPTQALESLFGALEHNPHALAIHQSIWALLSSLDLPRPLVARYIEITRQSVFYLDPHVCTRCRYRSTELLWQCPQCHEWDAFVEERITPASDVESEIPSSPIV
ncbi:MAG: tetratricopeptide repeat protein [Acidobacteria bacterium]|nr:tetratricopeptide repeat protein [Acidobacteriota bacterium]